MRNLKKLVLISCTSAVVGLIGLTGCKSSSNSETSDRTEGRKIDDKQITETVRKDLEKDPLYKFPDVKVETYSGVVQLSGFVNAPDQKQRAEEIARRVGGVERVVNAITMKELSPTGKSSGTQQPMESQKPASSSSP